MRVVVMVLAVASLAACSLENGAHGEPSRADCPLIAQTLTSLELGNYADPQARAPRERVIAERCSEANLSDDEARCLLDASKDSLPYCPKPLAVQHRELPKIAAADTSGLPRGCVQYLDLLQRLAVCPNLPIESRRAMEQAVQQSGGWRREVNPAGMQSLDAACDTGADELAHAMQRMGCS